MTNCWYRAEKEANALWIEAVFHGFYPSGSYKEGVYTFALVVAKNPDQEKSGYCRPVKIYDFANIRFDEAPMPATIPAAQ
jgi:hypothetical protein